MTRVALHAEVIAKKWWGHSNPGTEDSYVHNGKINM